MTKGKKSRTTQTVVATQKGAQRMTLRDAIKILDNTCRYDVINQRIDDAIVVVLRYARKMV